MNKRSEALIKAQDKYEQKRMCINIRLNKETDLDIIEKLNNVGNKQGYIKELIRKDIENHL
ncbi:MAG: hypothetical protein SOR59_06195 [Lachnospiraceae bacterium]|nr:hypothetical protein [Lachnospiraceae bacterium]MDY2957175.1 hypothetical protein [Lachnospiraceae bacterium]